jgi:hypothetical protein
MDSSYCFNDVYQPGRLSIPLNGFRIQRQKLEAGEKAEPFNSIEWIHIAKPEPFYLRSSNYLSIPLNGFSFV